MPKSARDSKSLSQTSSISRAELRIVGVTGNPMDDSEEPKWLSLLKDDLFDANEFPRLQIYKCLIFEAVLVPHVEVE